MGGIALVLVLAGCAQLVCKPTSIVVRAKEERRRLEMDGSGLLRTTETGRIEEVHTPRLVSEYWVLDTAAGWHRVSAEQFNAAEVGGLLEVCP